MNRATRHASLAFALIAGACTAQNGGDGAAQPAAGGGTVQHNRLTAREQQEGWRLLFDGQTLNGWRGYGMTAMPEGWAVVDGALTRVSRSRDIITTEQFRDFDLQFEWKTNAGGNSGVFYRAVESRNPIYHSAPEYQILDDAGHADGRSELLSAGANYALHAAPRGVVRPVGEWNSARIMVRNNQVEHWLNGQKIVAYELGGADWKARVAQSKFAQWPEYGTAAQGYIGVQGDHGWVALRNIRIRAL